MFSRSACVAFFRGLLALLLFRFFFCSARVKRCPRTGSQNNGQHLKLGRTNGAKPANKFLLIPRGGSEGVALRREPQRTQLES